MNDNGTNPYEKATTGSGFAPHTGAAHRGTGRGPEAADWQAGGPVKFMSQPFGMQRQRAPPQMLVPQPDHSVSRTPRPHHADQTGPGPHRGEQWNTPRTAPPASKDLGMKRTEPQRVRTRVSPLMELQDPEVFEVILIGNNMLPLVKRLSEFQQLSEQMQRAQSGTPPLRPSPGARPAIVAQNIQVFLDSLLAAIGLDDDTPQGNLLKSFLGMWCANGAAGVGSKTQREVRSTKSPRSALQPLHNQPMVAQPYAQASQPTSPPGAASEDERAAALDLIRRRREATRAQKQQQLPASAILSADEKADIIRNKVVEALNDSGDQDLRPQVHSPPITVAAYSAALREGFGTLRAEQDSEHTPAEHPPTEQVARKNLTRKFVRQAQSLLEQIDTSSKLKTWVNCTDEEAGLTFTQSLCSESSFDIIPTVLAPVGTAVTSRRANAMAAAPAPMESSSTTSNRVAAVAGYTASFRDMRSKFANAVGSISDQEYASSLLASQDLIQQTLQGEGTFKPNQEVFEYLVNVLKGEEEGEASTDRVTLHIRAGIALCNLCLNSSHNRDMTVEAGGIDALSTRLAQAVAEDDFRMQAVMAACFANLAADHKYKELIVQSSAMQSLDQVLSGANVEAASHAAGTIWSICVDSPPDVKSTLATTSTIRALIQLLSVQNVEAQGRAAGTLSEICIKNPGIKTKIANSGAFIGLSKLATRSGSDSYDIALQRLAACALCNLVANHPGNKRLAKRLSLVGELASLLKNSEVVEIQNAAASCIFNLVCKSDKEELEALEILPTLRSIKSTARMIDTRLLCATNNPNEVASPAFGTF